MITEEQVKIALDAYYYHGNVMREALKAYEQSKWVKFDVDDEATWPQRTGHYVAFDGRYVSYKYWDRAIGGDKRSVNQSWFVSESVNFKKVTHWQPLPEFKES